MTKLNQYFWLCLSLLILVGGLFFVLRPYFKITPAVPIDYQQLVYRHAKENKLSPALVFAVIKTESNFDPTAHSKKDAYGLMQITEETLQWAILREGKNEGYTVEDLYDPEVNIRYGCYILGLLADEFQDTKTALAAYNAGRSNVLKWLKDSRYSQDGITLQATPFSETNQYTKKVLSAYQKYSEMLGETV